MTKFKPSGFPALAFAALLSWSCAAPVERGAEVSIDLSAWFDAAPRTLLPAPAVTSLASIEVTVYGPDMEPVSASFPGTSTRLELSVPPGPGRRILVGAAALPGPGPIARRFAEAVADILPGLNEVALGTSFETKLVVPVTTVFDGTQAVRQYDDISGANLVANESIERPRDVDFDSNGRIYVAGGSTTGDSIFCMDRVDPAVAPIALATTAAGPENSIALAVDRPGGLLYHVTQSSTGPYLLYRMGLSGTDSLADAAVSLPGAVVPSAGSTGLAVDTAGMLYLIANDGSGVPNVFRLDPSTVPATVLASATVASIGAFTGIGAVTAFDVVARDGMAYLSVYQYGATSQGTVVELSSALVPRRSYGGVIPAPTRFVAILNKKFCLEDEYDDAGNAGDRLVSFDSFNDTSLDVLAPAAPNNFAFFLTC